VSWMPYLASHLRAQGCGGIFYLYIDFSPVMLRCARQYYADYISESDPGFQAYFVEAHVEKVVRSKEWDELTRLFGCVVSICAGGTIGNFCSGEGLYPDFQKVFLEDLLKSNHTLVTFLDARHFYN